MARRKKKKKNSSIFLKLIGIILVALLIYYIMENKVDITKKASAPTVEEKLADIGYSETDIPLIVKDKKVLDYVLSRDYVEDLPKFINKKDFLFENIEIYVDYKNRNKAASIEDIIYLVNNDILEEYSDFLIEIVHQEFFIKARTTRYIKYKNKYKNKKTEDVITEVNCGLDHGFYKNPIATDTTKQELMLVNKIYSLKSDYKNKVLVTIDSAYTRNGGQLEKSTYEAFKNLSNAAKKQNLTIVNQSAFRSYDTQSYIYNSYLQNDTLSVVDTYSARAGHSEHQTGYATDVATWSTKQLGDFEYTKEFIWMSENAHKYGFILRYPKGKEHLTGYMYEPWHYRYVGVEVATKVKEKNITFDEYYAYYILKK